MEPVACRGDSSSRRVLCRGLGKKRICCLSLLFLISAFFLALGIFFIAIVDVVIRLELDDKMPLDNGSFAFHFWQKPPVPIKFGLYAWDIVNPDEILAGTEVPALIEKGPYVYDMRIEKTDIKWHKNNTVEYVQPQTFVFNRELSVGPDTDTFLTINIPYLTAAHVLRYEFPWLQETIDAYFRSQGEGTFKNVSVHDIWWGYEDPVLEEVAKLMHKFNVSNPMLNGKFGFFMERNNTGDGLYNVYSGMNKKFDNYVIIDRWNGMRQQKIWSTAYANTIRGTDGSMHPPYVNKHSNVTIFDAYLMRSLKLKYNGTGLYRGIRTVNFVVPYSEFANSSVNPDNAGYCTPDTRYCIPSGAYNLSVGAFGAPIYASMPHFLGGDPYYQRQVKGLRPVPSKHQPYYDIQGLSGVSMQAARRYQIIIRTQSYEHFMSFKDLPVSYLPILWIDGIAQIDPDTASLLKSLLQDTMDAVPALRGGVFGMFALFLLLGIGVLLYWRKKHGKRSTYNIIEDAERDPCLNSGGKHFGGSHSKDKKAIEGYDSASGASSYLARNGHMRSQGSHSSTDPVRNAAERRHTPETSRYDDPMARDSLYGNIRSSPGPELYQSAEDE